MGALSLGLFLIIPQVVSAAGGNIHSGNIAAHSRSGIAPAHGDNGTGNMNNQRTDLHAAMVRIAEAESHFNQIRQRGNAHEILSARSNLRESERYYIGLLATSSGVSVTMIEELHDSGVSLAQIGYDLQMVSYPASNAYINGHDLDMSGLTMDVDHSVHTDTAHNSVSDHHGVIVSPPSYSRKTYPNVYNHQASHNYHNSGGMGGMH